MLEKDDDRLELERRLQQVRRLLNSRLDPLTKARLESLARDIEEQLK